MASTHSYLNLRNVARFSLLGLGIGFGYSRDLILTRRAAKIEKQEWIEEAKTVFKKKQEEKEQSAKKKESGDKSIGLDWKKPEQFDFKKWMNTTLKPAAH